MHVTNTMASPIRRKTAIAWIIYWPSYTGVKTWLSTLDRLSRQKLNRNTRANIHCKPKGTNTGLQNISRKHTHTHKYLFSAPHGSFSKIFYIIGQKTNLNRRKMYHIRVPLSIIKNLLEFDENEYRADPNLWDTMSVVLRALCVYNTAGEVSYMQT